MTRRNPVNCEQQVNFTIAATLSRGRMCWLENLRQAAKMLNNPKREDQR
jgi:hypothetical protein